MMWDGALAGPPRDQLTGIELMNQLYDDLPRTRHEAIALGATCYFTGKPCKHGHFAPRQLSNWTCFACRLRSSETWRRANLDKQRAADRRRYAADPSKKEIARLRWKSKDPEAYSEMRRKANQKGLPRQRRYRQDRRRNDPVFAIRERLSIRLWEVTRRQDGAAKSASTMDLVGCTREELMAHLEAQFLPGMNWDNRSEWHIDHILPCAAFDMLNPVHQRACFHYTNLRPLWAIENMSKQDAHDPLEVAAWVARFEEAA